MTNRLRDLFESAHSSNRMDIMSEKSETFVAIYNNAELIIYDPDSFDIITITL